MNLDETLERENSQLTGFEIFYQTAIYSDNLLAEMPDDGAAGNAGRLHAKDIRA